MIPSICPQNLNTPLEAALCHANLDKECPICRKCPVGETLIRARDGKRRADAMREGN
jgi:hypothetical protein